MAPAAPDKPHYHGHRDRLRERFLDAGDAAIADYELLEMLLYRAFPRGDTKPLAKRLIDAFGSFSEVLAAPAVRLREVEGVGPKVVFELKLAEAAARRYSRGQVADRVVLESWDKLLEYCRTSMGFADKEHFRILFLDKRNGLIRDEVQQSGTVDHTPVYPREVIKRALELSATALILVHNHPSGDPSPSRADIDMTRKIVETARPLGIAVHDHVIVSRSGHTSFRAEGLI